MKLNYCIKSNDDYITVRSVLKGYFHVSTRLLMKLKKNNCIFLNDVSASLDTHVTCGDVVSFSLDYEEDNSNIVPTEMSLDIIYEDNSLLIVNKPPFMAVHPTSYHFDDTLSNGIIYYYNKIGLKKKIRPVNRLDRNTSGLVIFAKNEYIQECLITQMADNIFEKKYLGIVEGLLPNKEGKIDAPISRKENSIIERKVDDDGFPSITHYKVLKEYNNYSLVEFTLETGRTHQIRVHLQHIGHPLLGDSLYGKESSLINRQALHCHYLCFTHPITRKQIKLECPLPDDMSSLI